MVEAKGRGSPPELETRSLWWRRKGGEVHPSLELDLGHYGGDDSGESTRTWSWATMEGGVPILNPLDRSGSPPCLLWKLGQDGRVYPLSPPPLVWVGIGCVSPYSISGGSKGGGAPLGSKGGGV